MRATKATSCGLPPSPSPPRAPPDFGSVPSYEICTQAAADVGFRDVRGDPQPHEVVSGETDVREHARGVLVEGP